MPNETPIRARDANLIVARGMREFALWWPNAVDCSDINLIVIDLSQSAQSGQRIAITRENCDASGRAIEWLRADGLVHGPTEAVTVTDKGYAFLRSLHSFQNWQSATSRDEQEKLVPALDEELVNALGPRFWAWLQNFASG